MNNFFILRICCIFIICALGSISWANPVDPTEDYTTSSQNSPKIISDPDMGLKQETRRLRGEIEPHHSYFNSASDYVDRFVTCFACSISLSNAVMNINLYDDSSLAAMQSFIQRLMEEPEESILYNRDPERLCSYSGDALTFTPHTQNSRH